MPGRESHSEDLAFREVSRNIEGLSKNMTFACSCRCILRVTRVKMLPLFKNANARVGMMPSIVGVSYLSCPEYIISGSACDDFLNFVMDLKPSRTVCFSCHCLNVSMPINQAWSRSMTARLPTPGIRRPRLDPGFSVCPALSLARERLTALLVQSATTGMCKQDSASPLTSLANVKPSRWNPLLKTANSSAVIMWTLEDRLTLCVPRSHVPTSVQISNQRHRKCSREE